MAMLAEPRRRKKYNLCPRGKALYEDDTRFGTKMLEKMGWSKGRGLGANEDGSQEFVRVRFKNDAEGLGYENRDDQWTVHEEGFNGLLKELNGGSAADTTAVAEDENASASEDESRPMGFGFKPAPTEEEPKSKSLKENISGVSLEEASKTSKARVHYKKFTRGKDLSQYSEKDLANIFGKKAADETVGAVLQETAAEEKAAEEEAKEVNPNFAGVQTVCTGLSVNDYFKLKMEALKNRANGNAAASEPVLSNGAEEEDENTEPEKPEEVIEYKVERIKIEPVEEMQPYKENKPKRAKMEATEPEETKKSNPVESKKKLKLDKEVAFKPEQAEDEPVKKKKKSKRTEIDPVEADQIEENQPKRAKMEATEPEEKKKKKSKHTEESLPQGKPESAATEPEGKKKKLKYLDDSPQAKMSIIESNRNLQETAATEPAEKKRKSKRIAIDPVVADQIEEIKPKRAKMEATESEEKKKKSKHANNNLQETTATEPPEKKKKKSKHTEESLPQWKTESAATEPEGKKKKLKFLDDISPQAKMSILEPKTKDREKKKEKKSKHDHNLPQAAALKENKKRALVEDTTLMEPPLAAEEPARKKKKNKKSKHAPEEQPEEAKPLKQKKDKSKESNNKQDNDIIIIDAQIAIEKKGKKSKNQKIAKNNVSADSEDSSVDTVELLDTDKYLTHEELIERRDSYNICTISSFCAEKFHIVNLKAFQNASLYQITGYGFDENNFQLNVVERLEDASRIVNLWEGRTNKYDKSTNLKLTKLMKKKMYKKHIRTAKNIKTFAVL